MHFSYHSSQLLYCLYHKRSSQPPVQALLLITCAGGIPRVCSRTGKHCTKPLWSWSYKHFSETTSLSVCRPRVFVTQPHFTEWAKEKSGAGRNAFALRALGTRARKAPQECLEPARQACRDRAGREKQRHPCCLPPEPPSNTSSPMSDTTPVGLQWARL